PDAVAFRLEDDVAGLEPGLAAGRLGIHPRDEHAVAVFAGRLVPGVAALADLDPVDEAFEHPAAALERLHVALDLPGGNGVADAGVHAVHEPLDVDPSVDPHDLP